MSVRDRIDPELVERLERERDNGRARRRENPRFTAELLDPNKARAPEWLFEGRILIGALNSVVGSGGAGKGTTVAWVAARLSRGELPGVFHGTPANTLILGDEDDANVVWTPRIMAAGGDPSRVRILNYADGVALDFVRDVDTLRALMLEHDIQLIYADQVLDHMPADASANQPKDVRQALAPLRGLARQLDRAVLFSAHPNKAKGELALRDRTGGSHQFTELPRSGMFLGYHPERPGVRALVRGKGNVGRMPAALTFCIQTAFVTNPETGQQIETSVIADVEEDDDLAAEDVSPLPSRPRGPTKEERALMLLTGLGSDGAWHTRKEAEEMCVAEGMARRTFADAFGRLDKETRRAGMEIEWRLGGSDDED
jgi:AAA domain